MKDLDWLRRYLFNTVYETKEQKHLTLAHILIIATIGVAPFLGNLDGSIVMIACPVLEQVFHTDTSGVSMIIVSYLLVSASFALIFGRLGDIKGPEKIFVTGFAVLAAGSLLCGLAPELNYLVASRVVQAIGSTMLFSTYCAVVATSLPEEIRGRAFGFVGVLGSIGFAVGAPAGGFILKYLSWHWLFLFNIFFCAAGFVLSCRYLLRKEAPPEKNASFDIWGGLLSLICMVSFILALNKGQDIGWGAPFVLALFCISIVSFFLFIVRERSFSSPLVDITIFSNAHLCFAVVAALLVIVLLNGILFLFPYFLELVKGLSPEKAGLVMMTLAAAVFIFSPAAGCFVDKKSPQAISFIATAAILVSCILFTCLGADTPVWFILAVFLFFGVSLAFFTVSNMTLVMSHADEGRQGIISAILSVTNCVGALMGVSIFQIVFSGCIGYNVKELHTLPPGTLMQGFHTAMLWAVILCIPAVAASALAGKK
ncbi:MAG: MFS transporter [Candidatus Xenobiia bacterium LiM19]